MSQNELKDTTIDLILDSLRTVMESVDDLEELHDITMLIDSILGERKNLLEAREIANKEK